jgi:hypothetical protein
MMMSGAWSFAMTAEFIDHPTLAKLAETGAVRTANVVAQQGGWGIEVRHGKLRRALCAQRSRDLRLFKRLETVVEYLKDVGVTNFEVNAAEYDRDALRTYSREDVSARWKRTREAAEHDAWIHAKVRETLADPRPALSQHEAQKRWKAKRAALLKAGH